MKSTNNFWINFVIWKATIILLVIFDQVTKHIAKTNLTFNESVPVIPNMLDWRLLYNTGAAWSSFSNQTTILAFVSAVVASALIYYSLKNLRDATKLKTLFLAFLIGGAVGNLIDRALFAKVTDFIDLLILPGNFPVFNFADIYINIAVALFLLDWFFAKKINNN